MKKIFIIGAIAALTAACNRSEVIDLQPASPAVGVLSATLADDGSRANDATTDGDFEILPWDDAPGTRTALGERTASGVAVNWCADDKIAAVTLGNNPAKGEEYTIEPAATYTSSARFTGVVPSGSGTTDVIYPASCLVARPELNFFILRTPSRQTQASNGDIGHMAKYAVMKAKSVPYSGNAFTGSARFSHLTAMLEFVIEPKNGGVDGWKLLRTDFEFSNSWIITGEQKIPSSPGPGMEITTSNDAALTCSVSHELWGADATYTGRLFLRPNPDVRASGTIKITLISNQKGVVITRTIPSSGFEAGKRYRCTLTNVEPEEPGPPVIDPM